MDETIYWISPSGTKYESNSKQMSDSTDKATANFPSAQGKGDYIQDNGFFSSRFSLTFQFTDLKEHSAFAEALKETGNSKVIDPTLSTIRNCQVASITRTKGFVKDILRYLFTVSFIDSNNLKKTQSTESYQKNSNIKISDSEVLIAESFVSNTDINTAAETVQQKSNFIDSLRKANEAIESNTTKLLNNVDYIIDQPYEAIVQFRALITQPITLYAEVTHRIRAYRVLLLSNLDLTYDYSQAQTINMRNNNAVYIQSFGAMVINAMISNAVNLPYENKGQLFEVIDIIKETYEDYRDYLDDKQANGDFVQDGAIQQSLSESTYYTTGFLYKTSFDLKTEYIFTTDDGNLSIYDVAQEYYLEDWIEDEEATLDFIEQTNDFDNIEGITFPKGHEVIVYV